MPLTDIQCEKLREAILNIYPYEQKSALESILSEKFNINLEYTLAYSDIITKDKLNKITHNEKINKEIKILFLQLDAKDLDLNNEIDQIESAIERAKNRDLLNYSKKVVKSTDDIRRKIGEENPQIVHICGHGLENGNLKLENDSESISPEFLKSIFKGREDTIKCVLLNACHSERATLAITQHIRYAIGMNEEIIDNVAIEFAKGFYDGLGYNDENNPYITAFNEGIRAITAENISQNSIPVLKTRISYEQAIYNLLQKLDFENQINDFIKELKSDNPTNRLLHKFLSYYEYRLKEDELSKFQKVINEIVDDSAIQSAYRKLFTDDISDKNKIISKLVESDDKKSNIPLIVKFANHLAIILKRRDNYQFEKIKGWINDISGRLEIKIPASDDNESNQKIVNAYLLIVVDDKGDDKFNLHAEYIFENENSNIIKHEALNLPEYNEQNGSECNSFEKIPNRIKEYYEELYNQHAELSLPNQIPIELFLPIKYLGKNLDNEWLCDNDFSSDTTTSTLTPIVRECNIVLRPRERINPKRQKFMNLLKNNFKRFNDSLNIYDDQEILHHEIEIIDQNINDKNFERISDNLKGKKMCVKLTYHGIPEIAFFQAMIRGGIAIAFWRRGSNQEGSNIYNIDNYLKLEFFKNNFCNLIEQMYKQRKDASYDEKIYPIGFLCDNPYRIPSIFKPKNSLKSF